MKSRLAAILLILILAGCSAAPPTASEPLPTASPLPPTLTPTPSPLPPTETPVPSPTPLPGLLVLPLESLGRTIPWLPMDETARPTVHFIGFNTQRPPFDSALVRRAFASAIDREVIVAMALKYKYSNAEPATTLTPPETLAWDLYDAVGNGFDPETARSLLEQAGYADSAGFPEVTIVVSSYGETAPGARFNMAKAMAEMWREHLGITVNVEARAGKGYFNGLKSDLPSLFWFGWAADVNDPDNFLREMFRTGSEFNTSRFSNTEFDQLVDRAFRSRDPEERQRLYIQAERLLSEEEAALIPLFHTR